MPRRITWIQTYLKQDREAGRAYLRRLIHRYRGILKYVARDLGVRRDHMFAIVWRESLWDAVDEARAKNPNRIRDALDVSDEREQDDWLARTRAALKRPMKGE